jgi:signal transduction histidine kinase
MFVLILVIIPVIISIIVIVVIIIIIPISIVLPLLLVVLPLLIVFVMLVMFVWLSWSIGYMGSAWPSWSSVAALWARAALVVTPVMLWILGVNMVNIHMIIPADRAIEIVRVLESLPLSGGHHALELLVAVMPAVGINVAIAADAIEIIEIDVQDAVALNAAQSQFHHHLICDKTGFSLDIRQSLSIHRCYHHPYCYDCHHYSFHNYLLFKGLLLHLFISGAKIERIAEKSKGKTINQRMIFPKSIGGNSRNKIVVSFIC